MRHGSSKDSQPDEFARSSNCSHGKIASVLGTAALHVYSQMTPVNLPSLL